MPTSYWVTEFRENRSCFSDWRQWNYIYAFAVKSYDILKVNNALAKYVYCVMGCPICNIATSQIINQDYDFPIYMCEYGVPSPPEACKSWRIAHCVPFWIRWIIARVWTQDVDCWIREGIGRIINFYSTLDFVQNIITPTARPCLSFCHLFLLVQTEYVDARISALPRCGDVQLHFYCTI
jgi:hypothetical protein